MPKKPQNIDTVILGLMQPMSDADGTRLDVWLRTDLLIDELRLRGCRLSQEDIKECLVRLKQRGLLVSAWMYEKQVWGLPDSKPPTAGWTLENDRC